MDEDKELEELKNKLKEIEKKKEIAGLRKRLVKLEGEPKSQFLPKDSSRLIGTPLSYKPLEQNLNEGLSGLKNSIDGIPHIIIGKKEGQQFQQPSIFNEKEQKVMNKFKKWMIIIGVLVVVGYGLYRILSGWIF
jgi:hypothetical protein